MSEPQKQAEEVLRESEALALALLNAASESVYLLDLEGKILAVNEIGARHFGLTPNTIVGTNIYTLLPPEVAASRRAHGQTVVRTGKPVTFEDERAGRCFSARAYPVFDAHGEVAKIAVFAADITDSKRGEEQLRLARDYSESLVRTANAMVIGLDVQGDIQVFNEAAEKLTDYKRAELAGRNWFEVLVPKDRYPHVWEIFTRLETGGLPESFENPILTKAGEERMISWSNSQLCVDGRVTGSISFGLDITERQRTEARLRESEERYRRLLELAPVMIGVAVDWKVAFINEAGAKMLGASSVAQLFGRSVIDFVHPAFREQVDRNIRQLTEAGEPVALGVETWQRLDGTPIEVELSAFAFRYQSRPAIYIVAEDVTQRKGAEAKLKIYAQRLQTLSQRLVETQENERRQIARELHDEIGQSLTAIQINLQSALSSEPSAPTAPRLRESLKLVEDLLQKTQDLSLSLRPSLLDDLGLPAALRWYASLVASRARLQIEFWTDPLAGRLDPEVETACFRVAQEALTNVVRHARAATVTVGLQQEDDGLHLVVHDDGVGFEVTGARGGARLGLVGMQERVSLAGGRFEFKSSPQQGTEVHAWFPLRWRP